jgi:hypothetical protein
MLPPLTEGDVLSIEKIDASKHETKPPARFTEGSLIKELERLGIGRPSTWATIVDVVDKPGDEQWVDAVIDAAGHPQEPLVGSGRDDIRAMFDAKAIPTKKVVSCNFNTNRSIYNGQ